MAQRESEADKEHSAKKTASAIPSDPHSVRPGNVKSCTNCGATKTPQWREGPLGAKTLCNACGVKQFRLRKREENMMKRAAHARPLSPVANSKRKADGLKATDDSREVTRPFPAPHLPPRPASAAAQLLEAVRLAGADARSERMPDLPRPQSQEGHRRPPKRQAAARALQRSLEWAHVGDPHWNPNPEAHSSRTLSDTSATSGVHAQSRSPADAPAQPTAVRTTDAQSDAPPTHVTRGKASSRNSTPVFFGPALPPTTSAAPKHALAQALEHTLRHALQHGHSTKQGQPVTVDTQAAVDLLTLGRDRHIVSSPADSGAPSTPRHVQAEERLDGEADAAEGNMKEQLEGALLLQLPVTLSTATRMKLMAAHDELMLTKQTARQAELAVSAVAKLLAERQTEARELRHKAEVAAGHFHQLLLTAHDQPVQPEVP